MKTVSLIVDRKIPAKVAERARGVFKSWQDGETVARKMKATNDHRVLEVGQRYRILITPNKAELMSHEAYNRYSNKNGAKSRMLGNAGHCSTFRK